MHPSWCLLSLERAKNHVTDQSGQKHFTPIISTIPNVRLLGTRMGTQYAHASESSILILNSLENIILKKSVFMVFSTYLSLFFLPDFIEITFFTIHSFCRDSYVLFLLKIDTPSFSDIAKLEPRYFLSIETFNCRISWVLRFIVVTLFGVIPEFP